MKLFKNKNFKFLLLGLFLAFSLVTIISLPVLAANTDTSTLGINTVDKDIALGGGDIRVTVVKIINTALGLLGIIAVGIVLYGGFLYMTSGGEEDKINKAKKILINGVIGLVIILSAFAITKFVLNKLSDATGLKDGSDDNNAHILGSCSEPESPWYALHVSNGDIKSVCPQFCNVKYFVVQSITPSTKGTDVVGMNNVVIRAVFSRAIASDLSSALKIEKGGTDVTASFTLQFAEGNKVIEAVPKESCTSEDNCLSLGEYKVSILDVKDANGNSLETTTECPYSKNASFKVGEQSELVDRQNPMLSDVTLDGKSGNNIILLAGRPYLVGVTMNDRNDDISYGGNAYVSIKIYKQGNSGNIIESYLNGPATIDLADLSNNNPGSSPEFSFNFGYRAPSNLEINTPYTLEVIGHDVDSNVSIEFLTFVIRPANCDNHIQDGNETGIDTGGDCRGGLGDSCQIQTDCSISFKCLDTEDNLCAGTNDCICKKWPYIERVEKSNGAQGNWITISGRNFGNSNGEIYFNYDTNNDHVFDYSSIVSLAQCRSSDVWHDSWIIAEVPAKPASITVDPVISVRNLELAGAYSNSTSTPEYSSSSSVGHVLNLHLDKSSGEVIRNSLDSGNVFTASGTIKYDEYGKFAKAFGFENDGDDPNITNAGFLKSNRALELPRGSVFAWIKKSTSSIYHDAIVTKYTNFGLFVANNKLAVGEWYTDGRPGGRVIDSDTNVVDGTWHHVGLVFDHGVASSTKLYVDGILVFTTTTQFFTDAGNIIVGANNNGASQFYTGLIDEVNIWNRVLSQNEITSLYNTTVPGYKFTDFTNDDFGTNSSTLAGFTYNDIKRPGLCAVEVTDGTRATSAIPDTAVVAMGKAFGDYSSANKLVFGSIEASLRRGDWSDTEVKSSVPFANFGKNAVYLESNGEQSNPVWFTILKNNSDNLPIITNISPATTTIGSYITITGRNFGWESGEVRLGGINGHITANLPDFCGTGWTDTQIIAKVATSTPLVVNSVVVTRTDVSRSSSGNSSVSIVAGEPLPSICKLTPNIGPAPLLGDDSLSLKGENFVSDFQSFYFWTKGSVDGVYTSWLTTSTFANGDSLSGEEAMATLPVGDDVSSVFYGLSMFSGPIVVKAGGQYSNGINYQVMDCRLSGQVKPDGFQCCQIGPEEGVLKRSDIACEGVPRDGGYAWRFTTGKMPEVFQVLEQCDLNNSDSSVLPSPTPWSAREQGKIACVNAQITVKFSLPIDTDTVNTNNLHIYTCGNTENIGDCSTDVTNRFDIVTSSFTIVFNLKNQPSTNLDPLTWYKVVLSENLQSRKNVTIADKNTLKHEKLKKTRPCKIGDNDYAYCFDFRTGRSEDLCKLVDAVIDPSSYETKLLGIVQDIRWPFNYNLAEIFQIEQIDNLNIYPQYFDVYGISNQQCIVMNVDGLGWVWSPTNNSFSVTAEHKDTGEYHRDSRGVATAWRDNIVTNGSDIFARYTTSTDAGTETIEASSTIKVDLGDPRVIDKWPSCIEACINTQIGAKFNQIMVPSTYLGQGIQLQQCTNESCEVVGSSLGVNIDDDYVSQVTMYSNPDLVTNTWYLVSVSSSIKADGGTDSNGNKIVGNSVQPITWKFKTKASDEPCIVDSVDVIPDPFTAYFVGQKQIYNALPRGAVDSCNPNGQALNPWDFGWKWSVRDTNVATTTNFSISGNSNNFCTYNCVPAGSDVASSTIVLTAFCGNGVVNSGEDCDIAGTQPDNNPEIPGTSCTFSCLRPGNSLASCGDGIVQTNLGEQCDPNDDDLQTTINGVSVDYSKYCSNICLWTGSDKIETGDLAKPICGSGGKTKGEACDGGNGCSSSCLNIGTKLSQQWCDTNSSDSSVLVCQNAVSVCGDGIVVSGEECEVGVRGATSNTCNDRCLLQNVCDQPNLKQCDRGTEGCNDDCTLAGSSLSYSVPSICGDGLTGIGEYSSSVDSCELPSSEGLNVLGGSPAQLVTSLGNPTSTEINKIIKEMTTKIFAIPVKYKKNNVPTAIPNNNVRGEGDYSLMCGYTEYPEIKDNTFNDCTNNPNNDLGVASNSCCQLRPRRSEQYPAVNAEAVCRNTYLEVDFASEMDKVSFADNVSIVQGYDRGNSQYAGYNCAEHDQIDVTTETNAYLSIAPVQNSVANGFWQNVWSNIKSFFANLFSGKVFAFDTAQRNNTLPSSIVWCASNKTLEPNVNYIYNNQNKVTTTTASLLLPDLLDPNVYVLVLLKGGTDGIQDIYGVSIKNPFPKPSNSNFFDRDDSWLFKTGSAVCKIDHITVDPESHLFSSVNSAQTFRIEIVSDHDGQFISPIPDVYDWTYSWQPSNNKIFNIPNTNFATINITPKGVEGNIDALAHVEVTKDIDIDIEKSQLGKIFSKLFKLRAFFCSNPWPSDTTEVTDNSEDGAILNNGFADTKFNFSFLYCADNNNPLTKVDDLPLFDNVVLSDSADSEYGTGDVALRRYFLFSSSTDDAIGVQVFENVPNVIDNTPRSLEDWYKKKFDNLGNMKPSNVAGYEALTDGTNYYVSVFDVDRSSNIAGGVVYNYIILFSSSESASQDTTKVFRQIINNLQFNTGMTEHNKCLAEGFLDPTIIRTDVNHAISELDCNNDFDCRDSSGVPLVDTSGFCSNEKTKFYNDLNRLSSLDLTQYNLDNYFASDFGKSGFVGDLKSGSFVPGYTNSKWQNSWGLLNSYAGTIAIDPTNQWVGCDGYDALTCWSSVSSTFMCPQYAQVYEYKFVSTTKSYQIFAPFEYLQSSLDQDFVSRYIDNRVNFGRSCLPAQLISSQSGLCGDGVINAGAGEQCEPPGSTKLFTSDGQGIFCSVVGTRATGTCDVDTCTWDIADSCVASVGVCGNGISETYLVEGVSFTESCDDGSFNGRYGYCKSDCSGNLAFCGDEIKQSNEYCDKATSTYQMGFCSGDKNRTCNVAGTVDCVDTVETTTQINCVSDIGGIGTYHCEGFSGESCDPNNNGCAIAVVSTDTNDFGTCLSLAEPTYDFQKVNSCSFSCNAPGGYCGDGITQWTYEQCDDANQIDNDTCTNQCGMPNPDAGSICGNNLLESGEQCDDTNLANGDGCSSSCQIEITAPVCGDGSVNLFEDKNSDGTKQDNENWLEQCDLGTDKNGLRCNPAYNSSCTYCSVTCAVETIESPLRCGNGVIDNDFEECDYVADYTGKQSLVFGKGNYSYFPLNCTSEQKGSYQCADNCQTVQNNCISCGMGINLPLPEIGIINPMVTSGSAKYTDQPFVTMYRENIDKSLSTMETSTVAVGSWRSTWTKINYAGSTLVNSSLQRPLITDSVSIVHTDSNLGIETNSECSYKLFFNPNFVSTTLATTGDIDKKVIAGLGDIFDYPVNNEVSVVNNEVIMSPAVPPQDIRVVIRWKKNGNTNFVGNFYSDKVLNESGSILVDESNFKYMENLDGLASSINLVGNISTPEVYVEPNGGGGTYYTDSIQRFFFHPIIITDYSGTQTMTFRSVSNNTVSSTLGFYVSSPNGPIDLLKDENDVWVEVYHYHEKQVNVFSIYKPDFVFKLSDAKLSASQSANYWHVFNIHMDSGNIVVLPLGETWPVDPNQYLNYMKNNPFDINYAGAIVTGNCGVRASMPYTTKCPYFE